MLQPALAPRPTPILPVRSHRTRVALPPLPSPDDFPECPDCFACLPPGHVCRCECGEPLATHPPLRKPAKLVSWMAQRARVRDLDEGQTERIRAASATWNNGHFRERPHAVRRKERSIHARIVRGSGPTARELEVAAMTRRLGTAPKAAEAMGLAVTTVRNTLVRLRAKGVDWRVEPSRPVR